MGAILALESTCGRLHTLLSAEDAEPWAYLARQELKHLSEQHTAKRVHAHVLELVPAMVGTRRYRAACILRCVCRCFNCTFLHDRHSQQWRNRNAVQRLQLKRSRLLSQVQVGWFSTTFLGLIKTRLTMQTLSLQRSKALRELTHYRARFDLMRVELQGMRDAQRASVVSVAGWQPRAVQRRFEQEVAMEPIPAESRVRQIMMELEDVRRYVRTLNVQVVELDGELLRVQRVLASANHNANT